MRLIWLLLLVPYAGLPGVPFFNKRWFQLLVSPFFCFNFIAVPIISCILDIVPEKTRDDR